MMTTSGRFLPAVAGITLLAGCNQTQQANLFDDSLEVARIQQWRAESALLPEAARGRYLADRMAALLPDENLNACPPRR
jgi:hypothetical protein